MYSILLTHITASIFSENMDQLLHQRKFMTLYVKLNFKSYASGCNSFMLLMHLNVFHLK